VNLVNALDRACARACLLIAISTGAIGAQVRPDTASRPVVIDTAARVDTAGPRPELRAPLSPKRAFLYSLLLPGYSQSVLGRHRAGALQLAFEAASIIMIRQSAADVREARRMQADSITISFVNEAGLPQLRRVPTPFTASLVRSRRSHLEDWIAVLLANHLFSAADGYVASLLWDLPAEVSVSTTEASTNLGFRVRW
jgi:hypothetical protein